MSNTINSEQNKDSIAAELIRFSLPLIMSGLLQQLYNWADAFIVGNVEGETALAAIGATGSITHAMIMAITGFTVGLAVLFAHDFGRKKYKDIPRILSTFTLILGTAALIITAAGMIFCRRFLELMSTTSDTIDLAQAYLLIVFIGTPFLAVYNIYSAALRGIGDSKAPFYAILISSGMNVGLDILLVAFLGKGVQGAAAATILSQICMSVFIVIYANKKHSILRFAKGELFCKNVVRLGFSYGTPPMIQTAVTSMGNLVLQSFMNGFGTVTVAAITTAYRIDSMMMLPIVNMGSAISTKVAQNNGAGRPDRAKKIMLSGIRINAALTVFMTVMIIAFGGKLISLFGVGEEVASVGANFFICLGSFYPVFGVQTALRGYVEGMGKLAFSSAAGLIALGVRIAASYIFKNVFSNMVIAFAEGFSWFFTAILYIMMAAKIIKKNR